MDCQRASKGLFLGLLCLVGGIIILIIFFVMKDSPEYKGQMFWIYSGAEIIILTLSIISALAAFVQIQKLSHSFNVPYDLDTLLSSITVFSWLHLSGTWPQFSLHTTWGVGIPMAVQLITNVKLWSTVTSGGGDTMMMGDLHPVSSLMS